MVILESGYAALGIWIKTMWALLRGELSMAKGVLKGMHPVMK
jgi:hypothetical protein